MPKKKADYAGKEKKNAKPLQLNEFVYLLPSRNNHLLDNFLENVPEGLISVGELGLSSSADVCVEGECVWYSDLCKPGCPKYCVAIKDLNCSTQVKVYFEGQAACDNAIFRPKQASKYLFVYGGVLSRNDEFETQTEDSEVTLTIDGSDSRMCCIFVHNWLYLQLRRRNPIAIVDSLPDPVGLMYVSDAYGKHHLPSGTSPPALKAVTTTSERAVGSSPKECLPSSRKRPVVSTGLSTIPIGDQGSLFNNPSTPSQRKNTPPSLTSTSNTSAARNLSPQKALVSSASTSTVTNPMSQSHSLHRKLHSSSRNVPSTHCSMSNPNTGKLSSPPQSSTLPESSPSKCTVVKGPPQHIYTYTELAELNNMGENVRVNVAGVVKRFRSSYRSKGTDYCCSFSLVDQSLSSGITCIMFNKKENKLPRITRVGEIVIVRRLKISMFNGVPQLVGVNYSSFHIFDGETDASMQPRHSSESASLSDAERCLVRSLREMVTMCSELNSRASICTLEKVKPGLHFDIIAQVVSILTIANEQCVCLSICDGTKFPFLSSRYSIECFCAQTILDHGLAEKYGSWIVDIVVYEMCVAKLVDVVPGCFVYLHDIVASPLYGKDDDGKQCVVMELSAQGIDCPDFSCAVLDATDRDVENVQSRLETLPQTNRSSPAPNAVRYLLPSVTICLHPNRPFTSVADVLVCSQVPNMFRCGLRALRILPEEITELVQLCCPRCGFEVPFPSSVEEESSGALASLGRVCPKCTASCSAEELSHKDPQKRMLAEKAQDAEDEVGLQHTPPLLSHTYVFKLVVEDDSGVLEAFVTDRDANLFLEDLPPTNLRTSFTSRSALWRRLKHLFGRNPFDSSDSATTVPIMDCCILSYYTSSADEKVAFRICHTILPSVSDI